MCLNFLMINGRDDYRAIADRAFELYVAERYDEGSELVRAALPRLPAWRSDLAHLLACLLGAAGRPAEAFSELRAAFDAGGWWHRRILVDDDDLAGLRDLAGFAELVERSHARAASADQAAEAPLLRRPAAPARGLIVALHGAGQDATDAIDQWRAAVNAGFLLMALDSTQRNTPTYRSWPDPAVGSRDIAAALATLPSADRRLPLIAAGFSAGGRQAITWALAAKPGTPIGFIAMAPAITPDNLDREHIRQAAERGTAGIVVLGDQDDDVRDGVLAAIEKVRDGGIACRLDSIAGLGHDFPGDFAERLHHALATPLWSRGQG